MKCRTSKAASVAAWSFSSSATSPRQKSDDSTSVGRKWRAANVDLPEPVTPTRATRQSSGILIGRSSAEHRHLRRGARPRGPRRRCRRARPRSRGAQRRRSAQAANSARVHSKRWSRWRSWPGRQGLEANVVLGVGGGDDDRRRVERGRRATRSKLPRRDGSRCSTTSTTAAASKPSSRRSR